MSLYIFCRLLPPIIIYFLIVHTLPLSCYLYISRATTEPPWQHGSVSRGDVGTMMAQAGNKEGSFLVRDHSSSPGDFVLSVYQGTKPQHYVVKVSCLTAQTLLHAVLNTPFNFTYTNIYIPLFPSSHQSPADSLACVVLMTNVLHLALTRNVRSCSNRQRPVCFLSMMDLGTTTLLI